MRASVIASVLSVSLASVATAGPVSLGSWSPASSTAFYGGTSTDCATCGIGFLLSGIPHLEYLHGAGESAVPFGWDVTAPFVMQLIYEQADYAGFDRTGWHQAGGSQWGQLFAGSAVVGDYATFAPPVPHVGFWALTPEGLFSSLDPVSHVQFALFRSVELNATLYFLALEDLFVGDCKADDPITCRGDHNDHVIAFRESTTPQAPVPEPATVWLLGVGVAALTAQRTKKQMGW